MPNYNEDWTLDRINPNKGYEVGNVKWVLGKFQSRNKKISKRNTSGATGVVLETSKKGVQRFRCFWCDLHNGKKRSKSFSINILGYDEAFRLACEYRTKMIAELNEAGAGYSPTHGMKSLDVPATTIV